MLVQQIALDQHDYPEDFSDISEFNVHTLIPKFSKIEDQESPIIQRRFSTGNTEIHEILI